MKREKAVKLKITKQSDVYVLFVGGRIGVWSHSIIQKILLRCHVIVMLATSGIKSQVVAGCASLTLNGKALEQVRRILPELNCQSSLLKVHPLYVRRHCSVLSVLLDLLLKRS